MMNKKLFCISLVLLVILSLSAEFQSLSEDNIMISVSIVGAVEHAGEYFIPAGSRLSEAIRVSEEMKIDQAADIKEFELEESEENEYSLRKIYLIRKDSETLIDLQQYLVRGDKASNPELKDGDVIRFVPASYGLEIFGEVNRPGKYEYCEGDRVNDLIELALGLKVSARLDTAELVRLNKLTGEISEIGFSPISAIFEFKPDSNPLLTIGDRVYIRKQEKFDSDFNVEIAGMAKYPGMYAIEEGSTHLSDILQKCGGAKEEGSIEKAYIQRLSIRDTMVTYDPEFKRLMELDIPQMSQVEYEYQKFKIRELEGKLNVDFEALIQKDKNANDPLLEDGDFIYIPRKVSTVQISGAVMNPGAYEYVPGKNYEYYITEAGGYANNAFKRKLRIIKDETGSWLKKDKELVINEGDMIFVPEKEELDYLDLTKSVFTILAQLATVILAVENVYSN